MSKPVRERFVAMRVLDDERELVKDAAKAAGLSVSEWARPLLLEAARWELIRGNRRRSSHE